MSTADSSADSSPVEDARDELQESVPKAAQTLRNLLDAEDERVRIRAAEAILDRAGLTKAKSYGTKQAQVDAPITVVIPLSDSLRGTTALAPVVQYDLAQVGLLMVIVVGIASAAIAVLSVVQAAQSF